MGLKNNAPIRSARYDIYVLNFAIFEYRQVTISPIFALPLFNKKSEHSPRNTRFVNLIVNIFYTVV